MGHVEALPPKKKPSSIIEGQCLTTQRNMGHVEAPHQKNTPSDIMNCNETAKRFGEIVSIECGGYPNKSQGYRHVMNGSGNMVLNKMLKNKKQETTDI
ncbi:hypothetical protein TIFTF001_039097 [Ficus carica]|uniref:Uncharacterized protein n=1 Tax=Ficus carica TaxID=3494 RepID=A0AA88E971_FICCA|nr:hypothetical protein TIFTF001_039089 [Ficus carica]GMN70050.1 hypothetical protein TIFTF001_039097 [Ficus carica]